VHTRSLIEICRGCTRPVITDAVEGAGRQLNPDSAGDHIDRLYRAAWALSGDREDAQDLVQETYARVLARPRFLRKDDDLGYLLRALRNTFLMQLDKKRRQLVGESVTPEADPVDRLGYMRPDRVLEAKEIYAAIAALPTEFRLAITAVDVTGLSYNEVAKALRLPPGTVRSRVSRARTRVAARLWPEHDARATPGAPNEPAPARARVQELPPGASPARGGRLVPRPRRRRGRAKGRPAG
jgi:RNA polymerase sigma-70 factor (ECF subfamily)